MKKLCFCSIVDALNETFMITHQIKGQQGNDNLLICQIAIEIHDLILITQCFCLLSDHLTYGKLSKQHKSFVMPLFANFELQINHQPAEFKEHSLKNQLLKQLLSRRFRFFFVDLNYQIHLAGGC